MTTDHPGQDDPWPSRARDHLANERTFLAWLRTAAGVMTLGLAITRFGSHNRAAALLAGGILVLVGTAGIIYGTVRYRAVTRQLESRQFTTGYPQSAAVVASAVLVAAMIAATVIVALPHN